MLYERRLTIAVKLLLVDELFSRMFAVHTNVHAVARAAGARANKWLAQLERSMYAVVSVELHEIDARNVAKTGAHKSNRRRGELRESHGARADDQIF